MGKFDYRELTSTERRKLLDMLVDALLSIKSKKDMRQFLQRLLTVSETSMLARRLQVAEALVEGRSYATIREELKVGISTILNVDSWLEYAVRDYQDFRVQQRRAAQKSKVRPRYSPDMLGSFGDVRHRYAGHFSC